jgi:hypothetical protein
MKIAKMNLKNGLDKIQELCSGLYTRAEAAVGRG